jgi:hypothetical protein
VVVETVLGGAGRGGTGDGGEETASLEHLMAVTRRRNSGDGDRQG